MQRWIACSHYTERTVTPVLHVSFANLWVITQFSTEFKTMLLQITSHWFASSHSTWLQAVGEEERKTLEDGESRGLIPKRDTSQCLGVYGSQDPFVDEVVDTNCPWARKKNLHGAVFFAIEVTRLLNCRKMIEGIGTSRDWAVFLGPMFWALIQDSLGNGCSIHPHCCSSNQY